CFFGFSPVFQIPTIHSLIHCLLFPSSIFDWSIIFSIALTVSVFLLVRLRKEYYLALFIFWRVGYNVLLGLMLRSQSDWNLLVRFAKRYGFGQNAGKRRGVWQTYFIGEIIKKLDLDDKEFNSLPVEFTTWILFRAFVDTVLVNDFLSHTLFGIAYFKPPVYDGNGPELFGIGWRDWFRYSAGTLLLLINYGIKMEGNRVVSDFAWYWGDFFFYQVNEPTTPTTDSKTPYSPTAPPPASSFELAPHPMYSVGYIGFYATALIAKSYTVFFVSLGAHLSQILFFFFVESHHFERTYGNVAEESISTGNSNSLTPKIKKKKKKTVLQSLFRRDLLIFKNFDPFRSTDVLTVLVWVLTFLNAIVVGRVGENHEKNWKVWQALFWRLVFSGVLGYILHLQSKYTFWSRHFIKFGETSFDAFRHWKIIYNLCQSMTYISFFLCAFMLYKPPEVWLVGSVMLKHTVALILILLHIWTTFSIHKTLGEYGWFFGDFFIDSLTTPTKQTNHPTLSQGPTYTGLYRFLNHPNAWAAAASAWGVTVVTGSPHVLMVTVLGQLSGWCFVFLVEAPHMRRRYGDSVRSQNLVDDLLVNGGAVGGASMMSRSYESGSYLSKTMSSSSLKKVKSPIAAVVQEAVNEVKPRVDKIVTGARNIVKSNVEKSHWSQTQFLPRQLYTITFPITSPYPLFFSSSNIQRFQLGNPITIQFTCARETLKRRDWIGIYPAGENLSTEVTTSKSYSRWMFLTATVKNEDDDTVPDEDQGLRVVTGNLCFRRGKIPWQVGTYEARYHYDGGYSVVAISKPFEIVAECFQWMDDSGAVVVGRAGQELGGLEKNENEILRIEAFLRVHVERCVDVDVLGKGGIPLDVNEDILARVEMDEWIKDLSENEYIFYLAWLGVFLTVFFFEADFRIYKENVAKRIVYGIKQMFGIEFSWHVVGYMGTVRLLARRVEFWPCTNFIPCVFVYL
ncbi:phospholipid methyltransferase-domain-containing protein, partial [Obelidium mucronatum]